LGDVWIANRAFEGQSVLTKIASSNERCVDRDGAGIDTSLGPTDVKPRGTDDCVIRSVPVGGPNAVARALAIDGFLGLDDRPGRLWVGLQNERRLLQLDAETGAELQSVSTPDFEPFDAAMDRWGVAYLMLFLHPARRPSHRSTQGKSMHQDETKQSKLTVITY
jgi:hypothetical protein